MHRIQAVAPEIAKSIHDILADGGSLSDNLKALLSSVRDAYKGQRLGERELMEEFDADMLGHLFDDISLAQEVARELERRNAGFGRQMLQAMLDAIDQFLAAMSKSGAVSTPFAERLFSDYTRKRGQVASLLADFSERYREAQPGEDGETRLAIGDKFGTIRAQLVPEAADTPLMVIPNRGVKEAHLELAKWYNQLPESLVAADGAKINVKPTERGSILARFNHLTKQEDKNNGERELYDLDKMAWLQRMPETLKKAQAKLKDNKTNNFAYVRAYSDGGVHVVIVGRNGEVLDTRKYDHSLVTQFPDSPGSRRDDFNSVWERENAKSPASPGKVAPVNGDSSSGGTSSPQGTHNVTRKSSSSSGTRLSIGNIWHGTSADFDAPSLHYVGTGEGTQIWT